MKSLTNKKENIMSIEIETYEVAEVANNIDDCAEARELIERLNLDGQKALAVSGQTIFPYRKITQEESNVYSVILPSKTEAKEFSSGSIPLRVLQVMSHADSLNFFDSFEIWHPADVRKNPLLIGMRSNPSRTWDKDRYILARWGEALESFEILKKKASAIRMDEIKGKAVEVKAKAEMILGMVDGWPASKLFTENVFYG